MSDGNLRFKCRPPVSMNITCGKSYSESKIRNMIANVVYGYSLPDSGTPASANGSLENVLAMAPPPSAKLGRRQSRKNEGPDVGTERLQQLRDIQEREQQQHREFGRENSMNPEHQQSYEEMNINGGHPHPVDDRTQGFAARRSSEQLQYRRASAVGDESMMMDYGEASMPPPSNHLQVLGTPPMESKDSHLYRSQSVYGNRSMSQSGSSSSLNSAIRKGVQKLHHSHSHPNIGQQRQQQFLEQQELQGREDRGIISGHGYPPQQQQQLQLQRQALRRESAQCHGSIQGRTETSERRFSHPAALQSAGRFLPSSSNAHSLSRRSSPGYEPRHQILEKVNIPYINQLPETGGQYDEAQYPALQYQRRMSQPHSGNRRPSNQLPPAPPGSHQYDRRASEAETFNYQHCEKHEKSNGSSMRHSANKVPVSPYSPAISHNDGSLAMPPQITKLQNGPLFRTLQPEDKGNYRYAYLRHRELSTSVYYQQPRRDYSNPTDPYAPDSLSAEEADDRTYARMRHIFKRANTGQSLARTSSRPNLYGASMSASKDLDSSMLRNSIKLTCFPNAISPANLTGRSPLSMKTDTPDAMAVNLARSSKIVIEITQSRDLQSFKPSRSSSFSAFENVPSPPIQQAQRSLRHTVSQSNLVARSTTSILGRRRSVSPDGLDLGSAKKRRADSISSSARDGEEGGLNSSASAAEAAAAAVVAAAASAARQQNSARESAVRLINTASPSGGLQIVGLDYLEEKRNESSKEIGLGVQVPSTLGVESPVIEALSVTKAPSYVLLEEQKELGIDYSLFTRVETATWRILIPPNVVASFRSEDFGLTLKPKLGVSTLDAEVAKLTLNKSDDSGEDNTGRAMDIEQVREEGKEIEPTEAKTYDKSITVKDGAVASAPEDQHEPTKDSEQCETIVDEISALKNAMEMEEVELVDE
ncbi:hypothetical protein BGX27_007186 [Mortierella sp. AM989]|nr:hypothetical protein BGX27_007186 [Mortierella sp. AM989]